MASGGRASAQGQISYHRGSAFRRRCHRGATRREIGGPGRSRGPRPRFRGGGGHGSAGTIRNSPWKIRPLRRRRVRRRPTRRRRRPRSPWLASAECAPRPSVSPCPWPRWRSPGAPASRPRGCRRASRSRTCPRARAGTSTSAPAPTGGPGSRSRRRTWPATHATRPTSTSGRRPARRPRRRSRSGSTATTAPTAARCARPRSGSTRPTAAWWPKAAPGLPSHRAPPPPPRSRPTA